MSHWNINFLFMGNQNGKYSDVMSDAPLTKLDRNRIFVLTSGYGGFEEISGFDWVKDGTS